LPFLSIDTKVKERPTGRRPALRNLRSARRHTVILTLAVPALLLSTVRVPAAFGAGPSVEIAVAAARVDDIRQRLYLGPDGGVLPFNSDAEVLAFLRTARVIGEKNLADGINHSLKLTLERNGIRANAIFRTVEDVPAFVDDRRPNLTGARDSFMFEVAAYELSLALGLDRVPPVVLRDYQGRHGSLQLWIESAMTEAALIRSGRDDITPARRQYQKEAMRVFDQLILNWDRHQANSLYDTFGKLWFIDHTRSFMSQRDAPGIDKIAVCDGDLLARLKALDRKEVFEQLRPYLSSMQIETMMRRRDKLVARIESMIEERGREHVLYSLEQEVQAANH
jgi:hypothetical protein